MTVTIRDVALAAGVSVTTVSHVLNQQGRVSKDTRTRVQRVAANLGYRANVHAQQLVTRRSRTLAIQVARAAEPSTATSLIPNSEYFLELLNGAAERADDLGYALILTPPGVSAETINAFSVDGAVIVDPRGDEPLFTARSDARKLVTTGRPLSGPARAAFAVDNDHRAAAIEMLDHLAAQGFQRPALVVTDTTRSYTADMTAGYLEWAQKRGIEPVVVEVSGEGQTRGARALLHLAGLDTQTDSIYASSEDLALDLLHELHRESLSVAGDIGLCSAVDSNALQLTSPTITGMSLHPREIGRCATELVVDLIEGIRETAQEPVTVTVPTQLLVRESTVRSVGIRTAMPLGGRGA